MNRINQQLNELFDSWRSEAHKNGDLDFVYDGLMNEASFDDEDWNKSRLRIMCISKDPYFSNSDEFDAGELDGEDYREYDLLEMSVDHRFWRNILSTLYGFVNADENSYPSYDDACTYEGRLEVAKNVPFAFVNIKKQAGESTVSNKVLRRYARNYAGYLRAEIREILCPNVIYCCGTSGIVMDEIYGDVDFERMDEKGFIFYNEESKLLLIAGYHPTARMSNRAMYDNVLQAYSNFLKDYNFPNNKNISL